MAPGRIQSSPFKDRNPVSETTTRLTPGEYTFDDLHEGDSFETGGIKVTETHVVNYAGISGDLFDVHMDDAFAEANGFPGRIAHGLLGLALVDGLKTRSPVRLRGIASLGWNWSFRGPIHIGDRISARITVRAKRETKRADRGIVTFFFEVLNQDGTVVQDGEHLLMTERRTSEG